MFPEGIAFNIFVPSFRKILAYELRKRGFSQTDIARSLGVTQAAISKMLRSNRNILPSELGDLNVQLSELELVARRIADYIVKGDINTAGMLANRYWLLILAGGDACKAHEKYGWRKSECYICTKVVYPDLDVSKGLVMADIERSLMILSSSEYFPKIIPEVLTNLAVSIPGARGLNDIVAVPGRISPDKKGGILFRKPEFGASRHLGAILLSLGGKYRAVINIKYDQLVEEALVTLDLKFKEFSSSEYPAANPVAAAAPVLFDECPECQVLVDSGADHIEPNVYLFGSRGVEVANMAVMIAQTYDVLSRKHGLMASNIEMMNKY
ncbi:MAG: thiamine-phosphate synthase family protein [Infirmifilum sp.]